MRELPEWVVLRYGTLYGPGTWFGPDGARAAEARSGELVAGRDVSSFVHADDAADAAVAALDWPSGEVNICDDEPAPGVSWVPAFAEECGGPAPPVDGEPPAPWARGATNQRARSELGWEPVHRSWRSGFFL